MKAVAAATTEQDLRFVRYPVILADSRLLHAV